MTANAPVRAFAMGSANNGGMIGHFFVQKKEKKVHVYQIRPGSDHRGGDLISDV
jgi:hypothetical protein